MSRELSLKNVPQMVEELLCKVDNLESILKNLPSLETRESEHWMNVNELCNYLPDKPSRNTVYGWVSKDSIPYHKTGKKLQFSRYDIDEWIRKHRVKTNTELEAEAKAFESTKNKRN